jgi:NADH-quinone oxidoreductase subunit G
VGCNQELTAREGEIKRVTGRPQPNWEVEEGWLCDRGRWAHGADRAPSRITEPLLRDARGERGVGLEDAVEAAALLLGRAESRTILVGDSATVEEGFIARELAEAALPGARVARLGAAGGGLGPLRALPGAQLADIDRADVIAIVGGDPANQQPVVELRLRKAARRGARVVALGPRAHPLETLGDAVRTPPGALAQGLGRLHPVVREAARPVVLWDELDLAAEPAAAAALARELAGHDGALQLELGSAVNGAGLRALGLEPAERLLAWPLGAVLSVHADPELGPGAGRWGQALDEAGPVIAIATHESPLTARAAVVLPGLSHYEREGVLVSMNGRAQRLRRGARGPEGGAPAWEILIALAHRLGAPPPYRSPRAAFAAAAAAHEALAGLDYAAIGEEGARLPAPGASRPAAAPPAREGEGLALVTTGAIFGDRWSHRSDALAGARTGPELALNPRDAAAAGVADGGSARVRSPHGQCLLTLRVDRRVSAGVAQAAGTAPGAGVDALLPPDRAPVRVTVTPA